MWRHLVISPSEFSAVKLQVLNTLTSILTGIVRPRVPCVSRVCPVCVPAPPVSFYRNPGEQVPVEIPQHFPSGKEVCELCDWRLSAPFSA